MYTARPKLSIGMPVFNGELFIRESLDSILNQSFTDFEVVISDNCSSDATQEICNQYAASDSRIRYQRSPVNMGATANYNAVVDRSTGEYFKWASSNDLCRPRFLEKCVNVLEEKDDVVLCYPRTRLFDGGVQSATDYVDNLNLVQKDPYDRFVALLENIRLNNIMNGVMRASALKRTPLIPDIFCGDRNVMANLVLQGKFVEVPDYLFYRRMDELTATHEKSAEEVWAHFDPTLENPMLLQYSRGFILYCHGVTIADISLGSKLRICRYLMRRARWHRGVVAREIWQALKWHGSAFWGR